MPERVGGSYNPPPQPEWIRLKNEAARKRKMLTLAIIGAGAVLLFFLGKKFFKK